MRIIISGGGTGGHIYPALAIAKEIEKLVSPAELLFVGTKQGLESDIVPKEGYRLELIETGGLERRLSWQNLKTLGRTAAGLLKSRSIIAQFKPDIVIGTGGYVCGPVLLMAALMKIPTLIQEQNAVPGMTNKLLSRFVDKVAVGYAEAIPRFPVVGKTVVTGNPIRSDILTVTREQGLHALGLSPDKLTVLVSGGSRGAQSINRAMVDAARGLVGKSGIQVLHVTGNNDYNNIVGLYSQKGIDPVKNGNIIIMPYLYNMPYALAVADLAVFRAGAIGLAELTAKAIPAVLVPYPYAAENHQEHNARVLEKHGAAVVIRDADLTGDSLLTALEDLLYNADKRMAMAKASQKIGRPDAAQVIAKLALAQVKAKR